MNILPVIGISLGALLGAPSFAGDDHGDTCDAPTLLQPGIPAQGVMEWFDEDWFAFEAVEGRLYYVDVHWIHTYGSTPGEIHLPACGGMFMQYEGHDFRDGRADVALLAAHSGPYAIRLDWRMLIFTGGPYEILVTDLGVVTDDHSDRRDDATPILADGADVRARIDHALDRDWFRTDLVGGMQYSLELVSELPCREYEGSAVLSLVAERGEDGRWLTSVSSMPDYADCTPRLFTRLFVVPEARAGEVSLRAEAEWTLGDGVGPYTFRVRPVAPIPADDHADSCEDARLLTPSPTPVPVPGLACTDLDPDWFAFDAVAGRSYEFRLDVGSGSRLEYQIYSPGCTTVIGERAYWDREPFAFLCNESGRYAIRVYQDSESADMTPYTVAVTDNGIIPDDHGNGQDSATPISPDGSWVAGAIEHAADVDVFRVPMNENTVYAVEIESLGGCATMVAVVEGDPSGMRPQVEDESGDDGCRRASWGSSIVWYYVGTGHAGDRFVHATRRYADPDEATPFRVRAYPVWTPEGDEHADACADAHPLEVDGPGVQGIVETSNDVDMFRFQAEAGHIYRLLVENSPDSISPVAYFPDAAGLPACEVSVREYATATVYAPRAGWHTIRIARQGYGDGMPYELRVIDDGPGEDDHLDAPLLGTWMPIDGADVTGAINFGDDIDAFRVRLSPFNSYRLTLRSLSPCGHLYAATRGNNVSISTPLYDCEGESEVSQSFYVDEYSAGVESVIVRGNAGAQYTVSVEILGCAADLNADSRLDSMDFFLFLSRLFSGEEEADFNSDGRADSQDLFDFLAIYFTGC